MSRLHKPERFNYLSKKRDRFSKLIPGNNVIYWWDKGSHFKCDTMLKNGEIVYGIGITKEDAINDCIDWIESMEN